MIASLLLAAVTTGVPALVAVLVVFLVLFLLYYLAGKFMPGPPRQVAGIVLGIIFLIYALNRFGLLQGLDL